MFTDSFEVKQQQKKRFEYNGGITERKGGVMRESRGRGGGGGGVYVSVGGCGSEGIPKLLSTARLQIGELDREDM